MSVSSVSFYFRFNSYYILNGFLSLWDVTVLVLYFGVVVRECDSCFGGVHVTVLDTVTLSMSQVMEPFERQAGCIRVQGDLSVSGKGLVFKRESFLRKMGVCNLIPF